MRRHTLVVRLLSIALVTVFSIVVSPYSAADTYVGNTYFENVPNGNYDWIYGSQDGSNSILGSVMPNWDSSKLTENGAGAIGTKALGIHSSTSVDGTNTDNRGRKQALYSFLEDKNKNGSEWERMGSASIVHQMLGKPWGQGGRSVTTTEWGALHDRLVKNDAVRMDRDRTASAWQNTSGVRVGASYNIFDTIRYNYSNTTKTADAWVFSVNGTSFYTIEIICANPLGNLSGLPQYTPPLATKYFLEPSITAPADGSPVKRSTKVTATGEVTNNGPDDADSRSWRITRLVYGASTNLSSSDKAKKDNNDSNPCGAFRSSGRTECTSSPPYPYSSSVQLDNEESATGSTTEFEVGSDVDVNTKVCFVASVQDPTQVSNSRWNHSAMHCFIVAPPSYNLDPSVTSSRGEDPVVEPGNNVQITPRVENEGEDESGNTIWELTRMIYDPSTTVTGNDKRLRNSGNEPCTEFRLSGNPNPTECENIFRLNNETWDGGETRDGAVTSYNVPDNLEAGTKICFATSISRPTYDATPVWRHSAWWCMTIGKKPKVQVWGGDVRAGGSIDTSVTETPSRGSYGSWVEYAALSRGPNSGFGSGAGLINGDRANDQGLWSNFTFANIDGNRGSCTAMYGCFESLPLVSALAGQFGQGSNPRALTGANLNSQYNSAATSYTAGDITLSASTISSGRSMVIIASGTVTIGGDISYSDGSYSNLRDIPQVVIIAPTINIQNSVGRVDAWLLAGVLNTCSDSTGALTVSTCNRQLEINGPVVANQIHLRRTAGSGAQADQRGEPAERFNLRADAFLWAYGYRSDASRAQTVYVKEMAPRF